MSSLAADNCDCSCDDVCHCVDCKCRSQSRGKVYDAIVIGAGIMGSATAYTMAKEGQKVLLLEQFPLPHSRGSSHGATRVIRSAYEESFQAALMPHAWALWRELERETGIKLYHQTGMLVIGRTDSTGAKVEARARNSQAVNKNEEMLMDSTALSKRYPLMRFAPENIGYHETVAGSLYADRALTAYQEQLKIYGGIIKDGQKVIKLTPGDTVKVFTHTGERFLAKSLAICCGGWSSDVLASLSLKLPMKTEAIQVCYWKDKGKSHNYLPAFISLADDGGIYGMASLEYPGLMKIVHHRGVPCDPETRDQVDTDKEAELMSELKEFVALTFPNLHPEPAIKERCMYTVTPDHLCIVDRHPLHKNIAYAAGFSGRGFKMAPVIGSMLCDLLVNRPVKYYTKEFNANRLLSQARL